MSIGTNIRYLRRLNRLTQEQPAEQPDIPFPVGRPMRCSGLINIFERFLCRPDEPVREDMSARRSNYSEVTLKRLPSFRMARYAIISPSPESDVNDHMRAWAEHTGLLRTASDAALIGWDFPFVTQEQQSRFVIHG